MHDDAGREKQKKTQVSEAAVGEEEAEEMAVGVVRTDEGKEERARERENDGDGDETDQHRYATHMKN